MRTDYFDDLLPDSVTAVTRHKPELVTTEKGKVTSKNSGLCKALPVLPLLPEKTDSTDSEAIAEYLAERAAIQEYDGGLTRKQAETEARLALRVFEYRLTDNPDSWLVLIAPGCDLEQATRTCHKKFGPDRVLEVREYKARKIS